MNKVGFLCIFQNRKVAFRVKPVGGEETIGQRARIESFEATSLSTTLPTTPPPPIAYHIPDSHGKYQA